MTKLCKKLGTCFGTLAIVLLVVGVLLVPPDARGDDDITALPAGCSWCVCAVMNGTPCFYGDCSTPVWKFCSSCGCTGPDISYFDCTCVGSPVVSVTDSGLSD